MAINQFGTGTLELMTMELVWTIHTTGLMLGYGMGFNQA